MKPSRNFTKIDANFILIINKMYRFRSQQMPVNPVAISSLVQRALDILQTEGQNPICRFGNIFGVLDTVCGELQGLPWILQNACIMLKKISSLRELTAEFDMIAFDDIFKRVDQLVGKSNGLTSQIQDLTSNPELYEQKLKNLISEFKSLKADFESLQIDDHVRYRKKIAEKVKELRCLLMSVFSSSVDIFPGFLDQNQMGFIQQLAMNLSLSSFTEDGSFQTVNHFSASLSGNHHQMELTIQSMIGQLTDQLKGLDSVLDVNGVHYRKNYSMRTTICLADTHSACIDHLRSIRSILSSGIFDEINSFQQKVRSAHASLTTCSAFCQLPLDFFDGFLRGIEAMKCISPCNRTMYESLRRLMTQIQTACTTRQRETTMFPMKLMGLIQTKLKFILDRNAPQPQIGQKKPRTVSNSDPKQRRICRIEKFLDKTMIGKQNAQDRSFDY
jgi:hypothetical protein